MQTLRLSTEEFMIMLPQLVKSGITFNADASNGVITIIFTGGY